MARGTADGKRRSKLKWMWWTHLGRRNGSSEHNSTGEGQLVQGKAQGSTELSLECIFERINISWKSRDKFRENRCCYLLAGHIKTEDFPDLFLRKTFTSWPLVDSEFISQALLWWHSVKEFKSNLKMSLQHYDRFIESKNQSNEINQPGVRIGDRFHKEAF